jgi:hypothetical protein
MICIICKKPILINTYCYSCMNNGIKAYSFYNQDGSMYFAHIYFDDKEIELIYFFNQTIIYSFNQTVISQNNSNDPNSWLSLCTLDYIPELSHLSVKSWTSRVLALQAFT